MSWTEFPLDSPIRRILTGYGILPGSLSDLLGRSGATPVYPGEADSLETAPDESSVARPEEIAQVLRRAEPAPGGAKFSGMNRGQWGDFLGGFGDMLMGYPLAERMMKRRVQAEQLRRQRILDELRLQHERRMFEQEQRQSEAADIRARMAFGEAGYRPLEPGEEPQDPIGRYQIGATGPPVQINKRPVEEYGGRRYVGPSPYELRRKGLLAEEAAKAAAGEKTRQKLLGSQPHYETDSEGNVWQIFGSGERRNLGPVGKKPATSGAMHYETDAAGNVRQIAPTGAIKDLGKIGKPSAAAGGEGTLAAQRLAEAQKKNRRDYLVDLEKREDALSGKVKQLRDLFDEAEGDKEAQGKITPVLALRERQLKRIRQEKITAGFSTREDIKTTQELTAEAAKTQPVAPKKTAPQQAAAPQKTATQPAGGLKRKRTLAELKAFAAAKGISEAEARKRFAAEHFEVE